MTHLIEVAANWLNVVNLMICVSTALSLWLTILLQQNSKQPLPRYFQVLLTVLAVTYAFSAYAYFGSAAGVRGAPADISQLTLAQISWMVRNAVVAALAIGGVVTAWKLCAPQAESRYETNRGFCMTRGKSAAQISILQASGSER